MRKLEEVTLDSLLDALNKIDAGKISDDKIEVKETENSINKYIKGFALFLIDSANKQIAIGPNLLQKLMNIIDYDKYAASIFLQYEFIIKDNPTYKKISINTGHTSQFVDNEIEKTWDIQNYKDFVYNYISEMNYTRDDYVKKIYKPFYDQDRGFVCELTNISCSVFDCVENPIEYLVYHSNEPYDYRYKESYKRECAYYIYKNGGLITSYENLFFLLKETDARFFADLGGTIDNLYKFKFFLIMFSKYYSASKDKSYETQIVADNIERLFNILTVTKLDEEIIKEMVLAGYAVDFVYFKDIFDIIQNTKFKKCLNKAINTTDKMICKDNLENRVLLLGYDYAMLMVILTTANYNELCYHYIEIIRRIEEYLNNQRSECNYTRENAKELLCVYVLTNLCKLKVDEVDDKLVQLAYDIEKFINAEDFNENKELFQASIDCIKGCLGEERYNKYMKYNQIDNNGNSPIK